MASDPRNPSAATINGLIETVAALQAIKDMKRCHRGVGELRAQLAACSAGHNSDVAVKDAKHGSGTLRPTSFPPAPTV